MYGSDSDSKYFIENALQISQLPLYNIFNLYINSPFDTQNFIILLSLIFKFIPHKIAASIFILFISNLILIESYKICKKTVYEKSILIVLLVLSFNPTFLISTHLIIRTYLILYILLLIFSYFLNIESNPRKSGNRFFLFFLFFCLVSVHTVGIIVLIGFLISFFIKKIDLRSNVIIFYILIIFLSFLFILTISFDFKSLSIPKISSNNILAIPNDLGNFPFPSYFIFNSFNLDFFIFYLLNSYLFYFSQL